MSTTNNTYYVYIKCGTSPISGNNAIIQPVPAVPGNIVGNSIIGNGECWSLIDISNNLSQLQNTYNYTTYCNTNYFTQVFGAIFTNTEDSTACENCLRYSDTAVITPQSCNITLKNSNNCAVANTSGVVYVNSTPVYSFDTNFNVNSVVKQIPVSVGDTITIVLTAPINSSCNFAVSDTYSNGNIFTDNDTITNTTITYSYITYCGGLKSIEIFSTCNT